MRKFTSFAAAAAVVLTSVGVSVTPAEARSRHGGWGYRHHDRVSTGDVLGGLLIIGTIAAIASAASKDKQRARARLSLRSAAFPSPRRFRVTPTQLGVDDDSARRAIWRWRRRMRAADACG